MTHEEEKLEFISMLISNLGRLRCDLVVAAQAIKGDGIRLGEIHSERIFTAAELIEKTQNELQSLANEIAKRRLEATR